VSAQRLLRLTAVVLFVLASLSALGYTDLHWEALLCLGLACATGAEI
jgi:hypothetical protein